MLLCTSFMSAYHSLIMLTLNNRTDARTNEPTAESESTGDEHPHEDVGTPDHFSFYAFDGMLYPYCQQSGHLLCCVRSIHADFHVSLHCIMTGKSGAVRWKHEAGDFHDEVCSRSDPDIALCVTSVCVLTCCIMLVCTVSFSERAAPAA